MSTENVRLKKTLLDECSKASILAYVFVFYFQRSLQCCSFLLLKDMPSKFVEAKKRFLKVAFFLKKYLFHMYIKKNPSKNDCSGNNLLIQFSISIATFAKAVQRIEKRIMRLHDSVTILILNM